MLLRSGFLLPPQAKVDSQRRLHSLIRKHRARPSQFRHLKKLAHRPDLTLDTWKAAFNEVLADPEVEMGTRMLSASEAAPICRHLTWRLNHHMPGRLICSRIYDYWNIRWPVHQSSCECFFNPLGPSSPARDIPTWQKQVEQNMRSVVVF
jgi:hypothetical protein